MKKLGGIVLVSLFMLISIEAHAMMLTIDPETPEIPSITGPLTAELRQYYTYTITSVDHQNDEIFYEVRCSDGPGIHLSDWCESGESILYQHYWTDYYQNSNPFVVYAKATDSKGYESKWGSFEVHIDQIDVIEDIRDPSILYHSMPSFLKFY